MQPFDSLGDLARGLRDGTYSSRELTTAFLDRIAAHDRTLNSFITVAGEHALAQAAAADLRLARGRPGGPDRGGRG